ncbi:hypothetical protein M422DRAFT_267391 [Sphaerobolus stellatus SS14]|uniref:Uncharacterized protein n=1 Tax=Sphaerobolus stellatus (strain SS14) TaxID=990650 RepID=A0A0C9UPS5_SPHS4|nr:hypothetical protein M422DRAFT_267391 [Sphaerobolus stellatus SS14]
MLPVLAELMHEARCSQHDNMYVRIGTKHNEWEVAIWDEKLNRRLTVPRLYLTGHPLQLKNLHCKGKLAIFLTDGCPAQALGLGDVLAEMNDPSMSVQATVKLLQQKQKGLKESTGVHSRNPTLAEKGKLTPDVNMDEQPPCLELANLAHSVHTQSSHSDAFESGTSVAAFGMVPLEPALEPPMSSFPSLTQQYPVQVPLIYCSSISILSF